MKKIAVALLALLLLVAILPACSSGPVLRVYNWEDYIDPAIIRDFTKDTGIRVKYINFTDNEIMYTQLKNPTGTYDVVFPSDYMIERMIREDMLAPLDYSAIPNFANLANFTCDRVFDEGNRYSVPYMWGTLGILYNKTKVTGDIDSWDCLWDETYRDQIIMINSYRDAIGIAMVRAGYPLNDWSDEGLAAAKAQLLQQRPLLQSYQLDMAKTLMKNNAAALAVVYSGDAATSISENDDLWYVTPKEGTNIWFDNMVVMKNSTMQAEAMQFIDYLCREDIAERNAAYIGYFSPIEGITEGLIEEGELPDLLPTEEQMENMDIFRDAGDRMAEFDKTWTAVKG